MTKDLKSRIYKWREKVGYSVAKACLMDVCVSESTAQKLLAGTYNKSPGALLRNAIETALKCQ